MHTVICGNTRRQECCAKESGKEVKIRGFMYRDTKNVEPEMHDYTSNNWSHWNSNEKLEENFRSCTRKTFDRFTTKDSYTWNITHNTESNGVRSVKPERWGSPLVQEKYQEENACDKRHPYRKTIIIISMAQKPLVDPDFLIIEASLSYTVTPHSVGLLWTSDRPDAENYT